MSPPSASRRVVSFGKFEVNLVARELRKNGAKIHLQDQPFQVLALLLENPGQAVAREELRKRLWSTDTFVDFDNGLNTAINKIREALGDSAENPRFVETLPRRGYRFIAPVQNPPVKDTHPRLVLPGSVHKASVWLGVAAAVLVLAAVGAYSYLHRAPKLGEKDSIVLADFTNTTSDPVFDGALRQGLAVQLEQTPFLRVISGDQVTQTLKMMEQPAGSRLTPALAREVCQRINATIEIEGSIAALGSQYVLGLNAINCATDEALAQEQVTADGKEKVLQALNRAASDLRFKLGESRASLKKFDIPLDQATTSSLEALQAYTRCNRESDDHSYFTAIPFCERAVSLDRNFAAPYAQLGYLRFAVGDNELASENAKMAYKLRDTVSEREKLAISADYQVWGTGDLEKAAQAQLQFAQTFPRDPQGWVNLGFVYRLLGRNDQALPPMLEANRLDPTNMTNLADLVIVYVNQNRFDQALATIRQSEKLSASGTLWFSTSLYWIDFLHNDTTGMAEQLSRLPPAWGLFLESRTAACRGQLSHSRDLMRRALSLMQERHDLGQFSLFEVNLALWEAQFGNAAEARKAATEALKSAKTWETEGAATLALALAHDAAQAQKIATDLNRRFPESTLVQSMYLPAIRAALALQRAKPQESIESLCGTTSYELAGNGQGNPAMPEVYVCGEAYLAAHQAAQAAAEFQKIIGNAGLVGNDPVGTLAHLGLGRAYAMQGGAAKARAAYQDFFALWKDADPDIHILKQAKAEYGNLK